MIRFLRGFGVVLLFSIFGICSFFLGFVVLPLLQIFMKFEKTENSTSHSSIENSIKNAKEDKRKRERFSRLIHKLWHFYTNLFVILGLIKIDLKNFEQVRGKIIVSTHPTFIDIMILIGLYDNSLCLAKKELLNNIFLKNIIKNVYIPNNVELDEFKKISTEVLNDGYNIIIFPTGTRTVEGEDLKIHKGAAALQIASGADIVPVTIKCDYPFLQKGQPIYDASDRLITYTISQLDPIKLSDFDEKSEIKLRKAISEKIKFDFMQN